MYEKILFSLLVGTTYLAGQKNTVDTIFQKNTQIPIELRQPIFDSLFSQCKNLIGQNGLLESSTKIESFAEDDLRQEPLTYQYFTTKFVSHYYNSKNKQIEAAEIFVESAKYDLATPQDNIDIISVQSKQGCSKN